MKKTILFIACLFTAPVCFAQTLNLSKPDTTNYVFRAGTPSIKALDSFPQCITDISKEGDNYKIALSVVNPYADSIRREKIKQSEYHPDRIYAPEVARYLQATPLIDFNQEGLRQIADTLLGEETSLYALINKALSFTYNYIAADDSLALQIDAGTCRTLDVGTILQTRKGTCSEYTNLFIALMRYKKIPARFCVGYVYNPEYNSEGTHAWPECYIDGVGWCAVEPMLNSIWFPHFMVIKMRHGLDFEDCDIRRLNLDIEPVEIEKA